ncbi:MAG: zinc ribbon domain-containing protein [Spirochaetota bacterium]
MPYCPYCGVEVDKETRNCPLCNTEIPIGNPPPLLKDYYPHGEHQLHYTRRPFTAEERRSVFWFFSLLFSVPLTIVIVVDLLRDWAITWSPFPIAGILAVWAGIAIGLFLRRPWLLFLLYAGLVVLLSLTMNLLAGTFHLFIYWNLPIILLAAALITPCVLYAKYTRRKGFNVLGMILWAVALFCIGLDVLISIHSDTSRILHGWSVIVAAAMGPVGALMMYVHYRFGKTMSFRRFFHA